MKVVIIKIAFDYDGILKETAFGFFKMCSKKGMPELAQLQGDASSKLLLNPFLFALPEDEVYVISNCPPGSSAQAKSQLLYHFFGDRVRFLCTNLGAGKFGHEYETEVAAKKVEIMQTHGITVYFDDDPGIIQEMRRINKDIQFIKYGAWLYAREY